MEIPRVCYSFSHAHISGPCSDGRLPTTPQRFSFQEECPHNKCFLPKPKTKKHELANLVSKPESTSWHHSGREENEGVPGGRGLQRYLDARRHVSRVSRRGLRKHKMLSALPTVSVWKMPWKW